MDLNGFFSQIGELWKAISTPIIFHIVFYFLYKFIFGTPPIKQSLENFVKSKSYDRSKKLLVEFELWTKLPLLLFFSVLIYLTFFSFITNGLSSTGVFPLGVSYSSEDFIKEYQPRDDIKFICTYQSDTALTLFEADEFKNNLVDEYKGKYPSSYQDWLGNFQEKFSSSVENLVAGFLVILILTIIFFTNLFSGNYRFKLRATLRYIIVLLISSPVLFAMRYQVEQTLEEHYAHRIIFVKNSLESDVSRKPVMDAAKINVLQKNLQFRLTQNRILSSSPWISRVIESNSLLQTIFGNRRLVTNAKTQRF